jgi:hypothetical protein
VPLKPFCRRARASDPPIKPVPTIVICRIAIPPSARPDGYGLAAAEKNPPEALLQPGQASALSYRLAL